MIKKLILASLFVTAQLFSLTGNSALFDDTEARKKIVELEKAMQGQSQQSQAAHADLMQRLAALEAITKNGLADMQAQIEALKQENAILKGELEVAHHNLVTTQQRQKDLYVDTDERLRKLETVPVVSPAAGGAGPAAESTPVAAVAVGKNSQEYQSLELAHGLSKESQHKAAFDAYDKFLRDYPSSAFAAEAMYGLGYSQFALKNYRSSIATQQKLLDGYAESPKVPEAMLNMANSQIQLGLVPGAKKTLRDLIAKFPNSEVIPTAQKRLKALEAIR